jgi:hypothetical protein
VKNILCVLEAISRKVYGPNYTIPYRYLKAFSLDHKDIKSLVERRAENKCFTLYRFNLCSRDSEDMIIGEGIGSHPIQFSLGKMHTMSSIIEKQGTGWDKIDAKEFFKCSEIYRREDINMSTTKEYEECIIMFSTMNSIRIILKNKEKEMKAGLNVPLRSSVSQINIKSVIIHFEKVTQECSRRNISIFPPQMT